MYAGFTLDAYQEAANRTLPNSPDFTIVSSRQEARRNARYHLDVGAYNLASETGEAVNIIKKHLHHGQDLDATNPKDSKSRTYRQCLEDEIGDVLWACAAIAKGAGFRLEDAASRNVAKLRERYPNGFNEVDAQARVDEK